MTWHLAHIETYRCGDRLRVWCALWAGPQAGYGAKFDSEHPAAWETLGRALQAGARAPGLASRAHLARQRVFVQAAKLRGRRIAADHGRVRALFAVTTAEWDDVARAVRAWNDAPEPGLDLDVIAAVGKAVALLRSPR